MLLICIVRVVNSEQPIATFLPTLDFGVVNSNEVETTGNCIAPRIILNNFIAIDTVGREFCVEVKSIGGEYLSPNTNVLSILGIQFSIATDFFF